VTKILYHWILLLDRFRFCETHFTTYQRFVADRSAISPFLGGMHLRHPEQNETYKRDLLTHLCIPQREHRAVETQCNELQHTGKENVDVKRGLCIHNETNKEIFTSERGLGKQKSPVHTKETNTNKTRQTKETCTSTPPATKKT